MTFYALDSDTVSYYLKGTISVRQHLAEESTRGNEIIIPPYVYYEVWRWLVLKNAVSQQRLFTKLHEKSGIAPIDHAVLDRAASLYVDLTRRGIVIDDSDILIASFCLEHGFTLVTNNTAHYTDIPGLSIVNWNV